MAQGIVKIRKFRVAQGAAIILPSGLLAVAGSLVSVGSMDITQKHIDEWMKTGYLEEGSEQIADLLTVNPPGVDVTPLPGVDSARKNDESGGAIDITKALKVTDKPATISTGGAVKTSTAALPPAELPAGNLSKWVFDPAVLAEKTLDQLNILFKEHAPTEPPFEDRNEAIAYLSMDFVPKT